MEILGAENGLCLAKMFQVMNLRILRMEPGGGFELVSCQIVLQQGHAWHLKIWRMES